MFQNKLSQYIAQARDAVVQGTLRALFTPVFDRLSSLTLTSAGLAIKAGASAIVKTGAAVTYALANGVLQSVAAATDMPALAGTVVNATFNCYAFFIDSAGTVTSQIGTAGATLAAMKLPPIPQGKALLGFIIVNPTGTGDFVGGTTALDDATVVPGVLYVNTIGGFDPQCIVA